MPSGHRDMQEYKKECSSKARASLQLRGKENFAIRMQDENDRMERLDNDHESHLLDTAAWHDVNEYVKECKRRTRLSLAFRAKEKRRHKVYEKKMAEEKVQRQHIDTLFRSEDAHFLEMARLKEKAKMALQAMEHSPFSTFGNPFATILK